MHKQKSKQTKKRQVGQGCELNRVTGRCEFVANKKVQSQYCRSPTSKYKCRRNSKKWDEPNTLEARAREVLRGL